jgi:hypothetical protein
MKNFLLSILVFVGIGLHAQDRPFYVEVSQTEATTSDMIQVAFTSTVDGKFMAPDLSDFTIAAGPNISSSSSSIYVNGVTKTSQTTSRIYTLIPNKSGTLTIGSAQLKTKGKTYQTNPIKITVKNTPVQRGNNEVSMFGEIELSKKTVYMGEPVLLSYNVGNRLTRANLMDYNFPNQTVGWIQEIVPKKGSWPPYNITRGNLGYTINVFKKELLYPNTTGTLNLLPFSITLQAFLQNRNQVFNIKSPETQLKVKPLPDGKPDGFDGAVGDFKILARVDKTELKANEGIDLIITLKGNGNFMFIENIPLNLPEEIDQYEPEIKDRFSATESGVNGSREFRYLLIPTKEGNYTIGPIRFSYFDPNKEQYFTIESPSFPIKVHPGNAVTRTPKANQDLNEGKTLQGLKENANDIFSKEDLLFGRPIFFALMLIGPMAYLIILLFVKRKEKQIKNADKIVTQKASKFATQQLKSAKQKLDEKQLDKFYEETYKALTGYLSNKLKMEASGMTRSNIRQVIISRNASEVHAESYIGLLDTCEMARFGMSATGAEEHIYNQALLLIDQLENELK